MRNSCWRIIVLHNVSLDVLFLPSQNQLSPFLFILVLQQNAYSLDKDSLGKQCGTRIAYDQGNHLFVSAYNHSQSPSTSYSSRVHFICPSPQRPYWQKLLIAMTSQLSSLRTTKTSTDDGKDCYLPLWAGVILRVRRAITCTSTSRKSPAQYYGRDSLQILTVNYGFARVIISKGIIAGE